MVRERSQGTARWMQSIRAALDEVTRIILMPLEQQKLFPRLPGEGRGLGWNPKYNKSPGKSRANVLIISGHNQKCLTYNFYFFYLQIAKITSAT